MAFMKHHVPMDWLKEDGTWRDPEGRVLCHYCKRRIMPGYTICVDCKEPHDSATMAYLRLEFPQVHGSR